MSASTNFGGSVCYFALSPSYSLLVVRLDYMPYGEILTVGKFERLLLDCDIISYLETAPIRRTSRGSGDMRRIARSIGDSDILLTYGVVFLAPGLSIHLFETIRSGRAYFDSIRVSSRG